MNPILTLVTPLAIIFTSLFASLYFIWIVGSPLLGVVFWLGFPIAILFQKVMIKVEDKKLLNNYKTKWSSDGFGI